MMPEINFNKSRSTKINNQNKENLVKALNNLKDKTEKISNGKEKESRFSSALYQIISDFELFKDSKVLFIISQLKLVIQLLYHLPKNKYKIASKYSTLYLQKIIENIENNNYFTISSDIANWYNSIIKLINMKKNNIDINQIAIEIKDKGNLVVQNPKQVKEFYQLFIKYNNCRFGTDTELSKIAFIIKYLQQIFKEVSYDGGVLFNEESYDSFTVNFGKTCVMIGENFLKSNTDEVFRTIGKFYNYTNDLLEVLNENKISKN